LRETLKDTKEKKTEDKNRNRGGTEAEINPKKNTEQGRKN